MSKAARYLKTAWLSRQFELARPLLPAGTALALWLGGKKLAESDAAGADLSDACPGALSFALTLDGEVAGALLLLPPAGGEAQCRRAGDFLAHGLQGMLDAEHARRAIAQEALEGYREMALLQRAALELNDSLKPAAVAEALLKEFDDRKMGADYGAVYQFEAEGKAQLMRCFGAGADDAFDRFADSEFFAGIAVDAAKAGADIVNDLSSLPTVPEFGSLLWRPLDAHGKNLGLLVLALQRGGGFTAGDMKRAQTLGSMAAASLHNAQLYAAEQKLFQSFVDVIAAAIDAKSRYTSGHCQRVPKIAMLLAEAAHRDEGRFAQFRLDEEERKAIEIAAKLHDCGKVVTPEWIVDKATKLDGIFNRIGLVALRFELLRRDALMERDRRLAGGGDSASAVRDYRARLRKLDEDFAFLEKCNQGAESVSAAHVDRIREIAARNWCDSNGRAFPLLSEDEVYNLMVQRGTLNPEERKIIEDHAAHTIAALKQIAFPRALRNVTEYAGGHHEHMDGTGYPWGLTRERLSIPTRIIAIADIFEALTAPDRPYRKPNTLNSAIGIMHRMKLNQHIDGELFDLLLSSGVYADYAREHLADSQIDDVDIGRYLGQ